MILKSLTLTNFRGIRDLRLEFSERVNLLAGVNGAGKTAILDCAAIMLSRFVGRLRSTKGTGRFFTDFDISNGSPETRNVNRNRNSEIMRFRLDGIENPPRPKKTVDHRPRGT